MKKVKSRHASWWVLLSAATFLIFSFHPVSSAETSTLDAEYSAYKKALEDTKETTQAEISRNLLAVVPRPDVTNYLTLHGDEIRWNKEKEIEINGHYLEENSRVLVVTFWEFV